MSTNHYFINKYLKRITNTVDEAELGYELLKYIHTDKDAKYVADLLGYELILY